MTDNTTAAAVRRTYYGSGTPVSPVYFDDIYDNLPSTDVLDPVLLYDNQYQITGYVWDANLGKQVLNNNSPVYETPAYSNQGGTGDRTAIITCTSDLTYAGAVGAPIEFVNGTTNLTTTYFNPQTQAVAGKYIEFAFLHDVLITEMKFYQQIGSPSTHGVWQTQGWDGASWVNLGSTFTLGTSATQTITELSANTTGYSKYHLLGVSGDTNETAWPFVNEMEFKIGNPI